MCQNYRLMSIFFRIPPFEESLFEFSSAQARSISQKELKILVWNLFKERRSPELRIDFLQISKDIDFFLFQEWKQLPGRELFTLDSHGDFHWKAFKSFELPWDKDSAHGVLTGSRIQAQSVHPKRGLNQEALVWTPKTGLASFYHWEGASEELLVLNVHALNFVPLGHFKKYFLEFDALLSFHKGPVILGGDFNTWNRRRKHWLDQWTEEHGLRPVEFPKDPRWLKLDHLFVRHLKVLGAEVLSEIKSSDHFPLRVTLSL